MLDYHFFARRALRLRNGPNIISILAEIYDTPHHMNWNQTVWALHVGFPLSGWFDFVPACSIAMLNTLSTTRSEMVASSTDTGHVWGVGCSWTVRLPLPAGYFPYSVTNTPCCKWSPRVFVYVVINDITASHMAREVRKRQHSHACVCTVELRLRFLRQI